MMRNHLTVDSWPTIATLAIIIGTLQVRSILYIIGLLVAAVIGLSAQLRELRTHVANHVSP